MQTDSELFWVRVENSDDVALLRLTGRFDSSAMPYLDAKIADAEGRDIVLDVGALTFMDAAAWLGVTSTSQRVRDAGRDFQVVNAIGAIRKVIEAPEAEPMLSTWR